MGRFQRGPLIGKIWLVKNVCAQYTCKHCNGAGSCVCYTVTGVTANKETACIGCDVIFTATTNGGCNCINWSGGGTPATGGGSCTFTTHWDTTGTKTVSASITADGCNSSQTKQVTIVEVDLNINGVSDADEENPGGYVGVNRDDDNGNGIADKDESGTVNNENDLVAIHLTITPTINTGTVTLSATSGGNKIKIWNEATKGTEALNSWNLASVSLPTILYVEGISADTNERDVVLTLTYNGEECCADTVIFTVVNVDLTATDLWGTVTEAHEESPGAFVHFNLDNDNSRDNSSGSPKRPGADYLETAGSVTGENDLKPLYMALTPPLQTGNMYLFITGDITIWKSVEKGSSNLVLSSGYKSWNSSDAGERSEFYSLCSNLWVEGISGGSGHIGLAHSYTPLDIVNYTFIAADCGDQPTTTGSLSQRDNFEGWNSLIRCEWSITAPATSSYNCIAWSVDETGFWYNRDYIAHNYGNKDDIFEYTDMDDFYYQKKGWTLITSGTNYEKAEQAEAMYYSGYHGARRKTCSCGAGKWIMYESKCGGLERIEHVWTQLNCSTYGAPIKFYK
jgi:hypothetical protein